MINATKNHTVTNIDDTDSGLIYFVSLVSLITVNLR